MGDQTPLDRPALDAQGRIEIAIEVPRFSFIKRNAAGALQLVSPLPCPFNYGSVTDTLADDGDGIDAIVLGPRLARGACVRAQPRAIARFLDAGVADPKWICSSAPLRRRDLAQLHAFFTLYAFAKRAFYTLRNPNTLRLTRYDGLELL